MISRGSGRCSSIIRCFPERANISLVQVVAPHALKVRTWERGAGLTRACGTAACAAAVAAARRELTGRKVRVSLPGGDLLIEWRESDGHILMTGPYALDFEGTLPATLFQPVPRLPLKGGGSGRGQTPTWRWLKPSPTSPLQGEGFRRTFMLEAANVGP